MAVGSLRRACIDAVLVSLILSQMHLLAVTHPLLTREWGNDISLWLVACTQAPAWHALTFQALPRSSSKSTLSGLPWQLNQP